MLPIKRPPLPVVIALIVLLIPVGKAFADWSYPIVAPIVAGWLR